MATAKCHEHQKYAEGKGGITCKEKAEECNLKIGFLPIATSDCAI